MRKLQLTRRKKWALVVIISLQLMGAALFVSLFHVSKEAQIAFVRKSIRDVVTFNAASGDLLALRLEHEDDLLRLSLLTNSNLRNTAYYGIGEIDNGDTLVKEAYSLFFSVLKHKKRPGRDTLLFILDPESSH